MTIFLDTEHSHLSGDIIEEGFALDESCFAVPAGPGLGVTVKEAAVERWSVTRIEGAYLDDRRPGWFPVKLAY